MAFNSTNCYWAIAFFISSLIVSVGCSQNAAPYSEAVHNGFYVYLLPEEEVNKYGWELQPISNEDWDAHCQGGPSAPWNPVRIIYQDEEGQNQLTLFISQRDIVWVRDRPIEQVELSTTWAERGTAVIYKSDEFSPLKFVDQFGNEVVVDGWLSPEEKVRLISKLEYFGPPVDEFINPWSVTWCQR